MTRRIKRVARTLAKKLAEHDLIIFRKLELFDGRNMREGYFKACEIKGKVYTSDSVAKATQGSTIVSGQQFFEPPYKALLLEGTFIDAEGKTCYISGDDELIVRQKDGSYLPLLFKITEDPVMPSLYATHFEAELIVQSTPWYVINDELIHEDGADE